MTVDDRLVFGAMPEADDEPVPAAAPPRVRNPLRRADRRTSPGAARRAAERRVRARRQAALRRSRPRMRTGSRGLLGVLVLASLTLILIDVRTESAAFAWPRSVASTMVSPIQSLAAAVAAPFGDRQVDPEEVARLRSEVEALSEQVNASDAVARRLADIEGVLALNAARDYELVAADVIAYAPTGATAITIDAGSDSGVAEDMAVMADGGLVGRVDAVGPSTSTVRLLSFPGLTVGARVASSGKVGALTGTGRSDGIALALLDPTAGLLSGDSVATFGSPGARPYPPGLPIGTVVDVDRSQVGQVTATVRPFADLTALSVVAVVTRTGGGGTR